MSDIIDNTFLKSNVIDETEAKKEISMALQRISDEISKSLGPYGSTTIIQGRDGNHVMSKDGYTILKGIEFYYDLPKTVLEIVKKISRSLVRTVGDGSTTSVVIANFLYQAFSINNSKYNVSPQDIVNTMSELIDIFNDYIKKEATPITDDNFKDIITKIATISTNNDSETGDLFYQIFSKVGKYGFINLETSHNSKDQYELVQGIEIDRGWINQRMARKSDKISYEYDNPYIFMCNDSLTDIDMDFLAAIMNDICINKESSLVIIAPSYSSSVKAFFDSNLQKFKHIGLVAIDIDCTSQKGKERFIDLALALDCHYYNKFDGIEDLEDFTLDDLGSCDKITGNDLHTTFIGGSGYINNSKEIEDKVNELSELYEKTLKLDEQSDHSVQLFNIKKRIATLTSSMATLYVGGNSEIEKETRKFLMEDAVYACRSALEYGYVIGGNLILPKIIFKYRDEIIEKLKNSNKLSYLTKEDSLSNNEKSSVDDYFNYILHNIESAFLEPYSIILSNSKMNKDLIKDIIDKCTTDERNLIYNLKLREYEDINTTTVINSAQTDIEIIKASFSIISLLSTSNQFIITNPLRRNE